MDKNQSLKNTVSGPKEGMPAGDKKMMPYDSQSPYPQIDDFLESLDPDELNYLREKCESDYGQTAVGPSKEVSVKDFMP